MTEKNENQVIEKYEEVKASLEQTADQIEDAALSGMRQVFLSRWLQAGLNWMLFFPFLLIERFTDYKIPRLIMFPLLAVASLLGVYDLLYGTLVGPLYYAAIDFINQELLNSLAVLTLVKVGEL